MAMRLFIAAFAALMLCLGAQAQWTGVYNSLLLGGAPASAFCGGVTCNSWSNSDKSAGVTISNVSRTATDTIGNTTDVGGRSVQHRSAGKLYWECDLTAASGSNTGCGFASSAATFTGANDLGSNATQGFINYVSGLVCYNGSCGLNCGTNGGVPNLVAYAVDRGANLVWCHGVSNLGVCAVNWSNPTDGTVGNPVAGTNGKDISAVFGAQDIYGAYSFNVNNAANTVNFGATPFLCPVPSGYTSWFQ